MPEANVGQLLLTERQAARSLGVSPRTVWGLADRGQLPVVRIGRAKRYDLRDIESLIQRLKGQACAQKETPAAGGQTGLGNYRMSISKNPVHDKSDFTPRHGMHSEAP